MKKGLSHFCISDPAPGPGGVDGSVRIERILRSAEVSVEKQEGLLEFRDAAGGLGLLQVGFGGKCQGKTGPAVNGSLAERRNGELSIGECFCKSVQVPAALDFFADPA